MKILAKTKRKHLILGILFTLLIIGIVYAADSYQVNSAAQVTIDEWSVCKKVTNNNALAIFVPTKTADEWTAFRTNASGVTLAECIYCDDDDGDGYGECPDCGIANGCTYDGDDCCDSDNRAYPGESTYYSSTNNCGSWDYDCSGTINKSNCTYDTATLSGSSTPCYWTSTCLAGQATGYQYCTETGHSASCGETNTHYWCTTGTCHRRTGDPWRCESGPTAHRRSWNSRTCTCK